MKLIVHHKMLKGAEESLAWWAEAAPQIKAANLAGQLPAKLLYTWRPDLTQTPVAFCLWEAEGSEQVQASLEAGGILEWMSAEIMPVEETDWLA